MAVGDMKICDGAKKSNLIKLTYTISFCLEKMTQLVLIYNELI